MNHIEFEYFTSLMKSYLLISGRFSFALQVSSGIQGLKLIGAGSNGSGP